MNLISARRAVSGVLFFLVALAAAPAHATPISDKYAALGGSGSFLGSPTIAETTTPDGVGKFRHYEHGSIYWHPDTGAHEVHGLIRQKWASIGWEKSYLGYPMTDEIDTFDGAGRVTKFQGGELIWRKATNAVSEVKSSDLVVELPFPVGESWRVVQANAASSSDSHGGPWAYCWDFVRASGSSNAVNIGAAANTTIAFVQQDLSSGSGNSGNVVIQRLGQGKYASYLHLKPGSYSATFGAGSLFLPQAVPWSNRPKPASGVTIARVGDTGTGVGNYHLHFCVTTAPDRPQFKPFESVPVSFRNYSMSLTSGLTWVTIAQGVPRKGQWLRRNGTASATVNAASVINFGTVNGQITLLGPGKPSGPGTLKIGIGSAWGEPLRTATVSVTNANLSGPWSYTVNNVPAYGGLVVGVAFDGPWSQSLGGGTVNGQSTSFMLAPNGTVTRNVQLKANILN